VIRLEKLNTEKRHEILESAIKLFSERGFDKTTVDEIAAQANVGKGTIYLYFANKERIFFAIIEEGLSEIYRRIVEILSISDNYPQRLSDMIFAHLKFVEDHREFYRIFLKERLNLRFFNEGDARSGFVEIHQRLNLLTTDYIKTGMEQGYLRQSDPKQFALALNGLVTHFAFHWILEGGVNSLTAQTGIITEIFLSGVGKDN
jgi:AcrR family transcriptional regulator